MPFQHSNSGGFTLIELLVVTAIIGMFTSILVGNMNEAQAIARDAKRMEDMKTINQALELFFSDYGRYPGVLDGIPLTGQLIGVGNEIDTALLRYLSTAPIDPLHDAGTGVTPTAGALFFYSYDPSHNLDDCVGVLRPNGGIVFGFNYAETYSTPDRTTCSGPDMGLNNAFFNRGFEPPSI